MAALAASPADSYVFLKRKFREIQPVKVIFGFDRWLKNEQGTTLKDGLSVSYYDKGVWRFGIMEYQNEPRIVKPINWDIEFWQKTLRKEIGNFP